MNSSGVIIPACQSVVIFCSCAPALLHFSQSSLPPPPRYKTYQIGCWKRVYKDKSDSQSCDTSLRAPVFNLQSPDPGIDFSIATPFFRISVSHSHHENLCLPQQCNLCRHCPRSASQERARGASSERDAIRHLSAPTKVLHEADITSGGNVTHVQYSNNWAGAVLTTPPAGATFNAVSGQFTVPTAQTVNGQAGSAAMWVGIDGDTYGNAILQAGVNVTGNTDGSQTYDSWCEWFPNAATDFSTDQLSFTTGDIISVSVTSSDNTDGTAVLTNESTGQSVTQTFSAPSGSTLAGQNAEWIVEDFESGGGLVSFANFGTVVFSNCVAGDSSRGSSGTDGATAFKLQDSNGNVLTDICLPSSSEVQIVYQ